MSFKNAVVSAILLAVAAGVSFSVGTPTPARGDLFGTAITSHVDVPSSQNITLTASAGLCGKKIHYTGTSAGTLTVPTNSLPDCDVTVIATSTGLASIAAAAGGTFKSNTVCTATPRTKEGGSAIWVHIVSNAGSAPVILVAGDCG